MTEPPDNREPPAEGPAAGLSKEELDDALSTLEHILRHRHVVPSGHQGDSPPAADDHLPLLKNVVVPGDPPAPLPFAEEDDADFGPEEAAGPAPHHDDLVVRLVNELEIIIESSVDDALAAAKRELMVKMKTHLDIVLPEILDELARRRLDPDREEDGWD